VSANAVFIGKNARKNEKIRRPINLIFKRISLRLFVYII